MALPPWTVDLLRRGVADLARQVTDHDAAASFREQATKLVDELPKAAREKVDALLRHAEAKAQPLKDAWQSSAWWGEGAISLTPTRIINATGCLLDQRGSGVGLPTAALAAAIPHLSGDAARDPDLSARLCDEIAATIARRREQTPHQPGLRAIVTNSLDASLALVATLGGRGGCVWVPRTSAQPIPVAGAPAAGCELLLVDRLRRFSRGTVREFGHIGGADDRPSDQILHRRDDPRRGSPNFSSAHDTVQYTRAQQNVLVRLAPAEPRQHSASEPGENWIEIVVLPMGSIFPLGTSTHVASVTEQLAGGADLVVIGGGALTGTPELSLIIGDEEIIQRLRHSPTFDLVNAPTALTAVVAASVAVQANGLAPVGQLLSVSEENLADRAQRLATQLAGCDWVTATRITASPATIGLPPNLQSPPRPAEQTDTDDKPDSIPSRQVVLTIDASRDAPALAQRLADASSGLLCRVEDQELILDLRWISPEQQARISELMAQQS